MAKPRKTGKAKELEKKNTETWTFPTSKRRKQQKRSTKDKKQTKEGTIREKIYYIINRRNNKAQL